MSPHLVEGTIIMCVLIKMGLCMLVTILKRYIFISLYCSIINVHCHALISFI